MFTVIKKFLNSAKTFDNIILGCNIENPTSQEVSEVFIKGWVLPKNQKQAQIVIEGNDLKETFPCDIQRDDVTKKILGEVKPNLKCGFRINWPHTGLFKIYFLVESEKMLIAEIQVTSSIISSQDTSSFFDVLTKIHSGLSVSDSEILLNGKLKQICQEFTELEPQTLQIIEPRIKQKGGNLIKQNYLELINIIKDNEFSIKIIGELTQKKKFELPSPFSENKARLIFSLLINDVNFLVFFDGKFYFYVTQYRYTSALNLIFPELNCQVKLSGFAWYSQARLASFLLELNKYSSVFNASKNLNEHDVCLILGDNRPAHYFYNFMCGLYSAKIKGFLTDKTKLASIKGLDFLDIAEYLPKNKVKVGDHSYINKLLSHNQLLGVMPILPFEVIISKDKRMIIDQLDESLLSYANKKFKDSEFDNQNNWLFQCEPLIWIGISTEKRCWLEQIDGISRILKALSTVYPDLGVVFDGITSTISAQIRADKEEEVVASILSKLPKSISYTSLIGKTSIEKIRFAQHCDFFITSYSTDSLYISRIAKKSGIVHFAKAIGADKQLNIHHDIIEVEEAYITDIPNPKFPNEWHKSSYSIDPNHVYKKVLTLLHHINYKNVDLLPDSL